MSYVDKESEEEFNEWLESIVLVDEDWQPLEPILTDDLSPDPEGDRA